MSEVTFDVEVIFGHIELRSWMEADPRNPKRLIGMGQAIHYDGKGNIKKVVTEPTGCVLEMP